jgi:DNA-binding response OmpR family regulator
MERWRILAVDDEPDILELVQMTLSGHYNVATTDSGLNIMEIIEAFEPDLIILDIMMPKITGYHILEVLKNRKETARIPVIFLSAKDTIRDQKYGYKLGAIAYLTKPFQPDRLVRNVQSIFEHTPPDRDDKTHGYTAALERVKKINLGIPEEAEETPAPKVPTTKAVHGREAETPEDKRWRG